MENTRFNHFFAYDNVAIVPSFLVSSFPKFKYKLSTLNVIIKENQIIAVCVSTKEFLNKDTFDNSTIYGIGILDLGSAELFYLDCDNDLVRTKILDVLVSTTRLNLIIFFKTIPTPAVSTFFVKYGFVKPIYNESLDRIEMILQERIPTSRTLNNLDRLIKSLTLKYIPITIFIPKSTAVVLGKIVHYMNEAAGYLSITKYNSNGIAIMGINTDNINQGGRFQVEAPSHKSPFTFHSHPDHATREYKTFISWPSGSDMAAITQTYFKFTSQIAHFISSPEGLWVINPTINFQLLLKLLRPLVLTCGTDLLKAIHTVYTSFEKVRYSSVVDPNDRYKICTLYINKVSTYTIGDLIRDVPILSRYCISIIYKYRNSPLFDVKLIKWKQFDSVEGGVILAFEYSQDADAGLKSFIEPFS